MSETDRNDTERTDTFRVRRKPGYVLRVDNLTRDRVEGYWNSSRKEWFPLDWLEAGKSLVERDQSDRSVDTETEQ